MDDLDLDLDLDLGFDLEDESKPKAQADEDDEKHILTHRMSHRHIARRATSDTNLENAMDWYFREGDCYHCFTFGT